MGFLKSGAAKSLQLVKVEEVSPYVISVVLARAHKRNALDVTLFSELGTVFRGLAQDEDCRVIVLSGEGPLFSSGIDLGYLAESATEIQSRNVDVSRTAKYYHEFIVWLQNELNTLQECPKPVIAAIHSLCLGAGVDLVCAADIRLCTSDATFQVTEVNLGIAADLGTLQRLPKIVGNQSLVNELCFTGRRFESSEADEMGFVSHVYNSRDSLMSAAFGMASNIAQKSPVAVQSVKVNLNYSRDNKIKDGLDYMARWNALHLQSEDVAKAFMERGKEGPHTFAKL